MLKVLFINSEWNGVAYWRMWEPARFLNKRKDIKVTYWTEEKKMSKKGTEWEKLAKTHDVIVSGRTSDPSSLATLMAIREISQKPIVMEMDDNWWDVDPNSPAFKHWAPGGEAFHTAEVQCEKSDFFQFSTFPLKKQMCQVFGKHEKSYLAPNLIDFDLWQEKEKKYKSMPKRGMIRLGWGGSCTHYSDFKHILPALTKVMNKYPNVEFVNRGMKADFFVYSECKREYDKLMGFDVTRQKSPLPLDRVKVLQGCNFMVWPDAVARMGIDIAIVPLVDSKFNQAKSNCRYLEFSALGIPGVYSPVYPYSKTIKDGVDGFLPSFNRTEKWVECLSELIENESKRKEMGEAAKQKCFEEYSLQKNVHKWADMYHSMHSRISECEFVPYYSEEKWTQLQGSQPTT